MTLERNIEHSVPLIDEIERDVYNFRKENRTEQLCICFAYSFYSVQLLLVMKRN